MDFLRGIFSSYWFNRSVDVRFQKFTNSLLGVNGLT